jgi:hypothetical protein
MPAGSRRYEKTRKCALGAPDFFGARDFVLRRERCSRRGAQKHEGCGTQRMQSEGAGLKPSATLKAKADPSPSATADSSG